MSKQLGFKSFNDFLNEALLHFLKFKKNEKPISSSSEEIKSEIHSLKVSGTTYETSERHLPLTPVNVIAAQYSHLGPEAFNLRDELNEELKEKLKAMKVS